MPSSVLKNLALWFLYFLDLFCDLNTLYPPPRRIFFKQHWETHGYVGKSQLIHNANNWCIWYWCSCRNAMRQIQQTQRKDVFMLEPRQQRLFVIAFHLRSDAWILGYYDLLKTLWNHQTVFSQRVTTQLYLSSCLSRINHKNCFKAPVDIRSNLDL